ncbi:hypothetical protein F3Y22_tig00110229pilonHSYRG00035 [Hibiscus syriacus]|uniref:RING-type E3 ubiquitin transferase n=1 Tax=Hibiscus syriacus TaxID=106335 RepID=A0A6A3BB10_HIBSY|nr:hypothetical protein F3Y22_tig00110229pilonHSYRG00035 [Hibiscus syriacus]
MGHGFLETWRDGIPLLLSILAISRVCYHWRSYGSWGFGFELEIGQRGCDSIQVCRFEQMRFSILSQPPTTDDGATTPWCCSVRHLHAATTGIVPDDGVQKVKPKETEELNDVSQDDEELQRRAVMEALTAKIFADREDYIYSGEYEMLFGQFAENENAFTERPPALKSVVENLPSVVVTQEDLANNNAQCAVCKDEINLGEALKQLPCAHRYYGDCNPGSG